MTRIHEDEGDSPAELAAIARLDRQWAALRTELNSGALTSGADRQVTERLRSTYAPLSGHIQSLALRESADAKADQVHNSAYVHRLIWGIVVAVLLTCGFFALLAVMVARRLRRAIEPARDQVEFAETLQLAENESEAHRLLQRQLERLVTGSEVTVLNRNNSADRLEAMTEVPADTRWLSR